MKKLMSVLGLVLISSAITGCSGVAVQAPQPDRLVSSYYKETASFERSDGEYNTAPVFDIMIPIVNKDMNEARQNLVKEGMNLCWQVSAGKFFVRGPERLAVMDDGTDLVWRIVCDPVGYYTNRADNKTVISPGYLIKYGPKTLKQ